MTAERRILIWLALIAAAILLINFLSPVLLPFVAGAAIAYFLDPIVSRLQAKGWSRTLATTVIAIAFFGLAAGTILALAPLIQRQVFDLAANLPKYLQSLWDVTEWLLFELKARLGPQEVERVREAVGSYAGDALLWVGQMFGKVWSGGLALLNLLSLIFITPLATFYLLRDWPRILSRLDVLLPRREASSIRAIFAEINRSLGGFMRGQAMVCLAMGVFYSVGLTLAGLQYGLILGIFIGFLVAVPILGAMIGAILSIGVALVQFTAWQDIAIIAAIFVAGQAIEGNLLQPKLVGDRVGLHPLWVVFALLAGGVVAGLVGVILAVPVAAATGVVVRHAIGRYMKSALYSGPSDPSGSTHS
jgi:predicted PurR-regulated permease PerM